jgi:DinB family protein
MSAVAVKAGIPKGLDGRVLSRIADEGYGPGAWHGADLKAALAEVTPELAFWRPAQGRHNIAEVAVHHAYCARAVRAQLTGAPAAPFVLEGEDWFALSESGPLTWPDILDVVETEQRALAAAVADLTAGRGQSPLTDAERFDLVLGITCHAIYHAGQVQLLKKLRG